MVPVIYTTFSADGLSVKCAARLPHPPFLNKTIVFLIKHGKFLTMSAGLTSCCVKKQAGTNDQQIY